MCLNEKSKNADHKVLVPMTIEALPVNNQGNSRDYASLTPEFAKLAFDTRGDKLLDQPFTKTSEPLEAGIHLHWALPDGLTHGVQDEQGEVKFPSVPNRWLVVRLSTDVKTFKQPQVRSKGWIIESDYLSEKKEKDERKITYPTLHDEQLYHFLGKTFGYEEWISEQDSDALYLDELQAVGPGDPAFAAYYPNSRGVFGFHDSEVTELTEGEFTYLVVGWYSRPEQDPLCCDKAEDWDHQMAQMGWTVTRPEASHPTSTLCHGLIVNVPWSGVEGEYEDGVSDEQVEVAIGNTYVEALSALISSKFSSSPDEMERLFSAFQYNLLTKWANVDGISEVEAKLHERTFVSKHGGIRWMVRLKDQKQKEGPLPDDVRQEVDELNCIQRRLERVSSELASAQWNLYSLWYRYISELTITPKVKGSILDSEKFGAEFLRLKEQIIGYKKSQKTLLEKRCAYQNCLQSIIEQTLAGYTLVEVPGPRFWEAHNPVLMLSGDGLQRSFKHGFDHRFSEDDKLECRITGQTVTGMKIPFAGHEVTIGLDDLEHVYPFSDGYLASEMGDLFVESILLSEDLAPFLAQLVVQRAEDTSVTPTEHAKLVRECRKVQLLHWNGYVDPVHTGIEDKIVGTLPSKIGFELWQPPWTPLFLQWEVEYYPSVPEEQIYHTLEKWQLEDYDYTWNQESALPESKGFYQGLSILTPSAVVYLQDILQENDTSLGHLDEKLIEKVGHLQVLAQGMSGLNRAFLQQKESLQFETFDPYRDPEAAEVVNELVGEHYHYSPVTYGGFYPIRAGFMRLVRLWIIDAFGRIKQVEGNLDEPVRSELLKPEVDKATNLIKLAPKINQPARLDFRWESGIMGWVLPNFLDKTIMIYDQDGKLICSLRRSLKSGQKDILEWLVPEWRENENARDPDLSGFIAGLTSEGDDVNPVDDLLEYLNSLLMGNGLNLPGKEMDLSILLGRPLALIRGSLKLELLGKPPIHQGFDYIGQEETLGFEKIQFPVRFGDVTKFQNGLFGYFVKEKDVTETYQQMYAVNGKKPEGKYIVDDQELTLSCNPAASRKHVVFLVDPEKGIHLRTGILPEKFIRFSEEDYRDALNRLDYHFTVQPILTHPSKFRLPLPGIKDAHWEFVYQQPEGHQVKTEDELQNADGSASYYPGSKEIYEGWLRLTNRKERKEGINR